MFTTGTIKKFMPPKTVYRLNANPIKIPITFFTEIEKTILNFIWKPQEKSIAKELWSKKNRVRVICS